MNFKTEVDYEKIKVIKKDHQTTRRLVDYRNYVTFLSSDWIILKFPVQKNIDHLRSVTLYYKLYSCEGRATSVVYQLVSEPKACKLWFMPVDYLSLKFKSSKRSVQQTIHMFETVALLCAQHVTYNFHFTTVLDMV